MNTVHEFYQTPSAPPIDVLVDENNFCTDSDSINSTKKTNTAVPVPSIANTNTNNTLDFAVSQQIPEFYADQFNSSRWLAQYEEASSSQDRTILKEIIQRQTEAILKTKGYTLFDKHVTLNLYPRQLTYINHSNPNEIQIRDCNFARKFNTIAHFMNNDSIGGIDNISTYTYVKVKETTNPVIVVPNDINLNATKELCLTSSLLYLLKGKNEQLKCCSVHVPNVEVFRKCEKDGYTFLNAPISVNIIYVSSEPHDQSETTLIRKVKAILKLSALLKYDTVIFTLSTFYDYDLKLVGSVIFNLVSGEFSNVFKHVAFIIESNDGCINVNVFNDFKNSFNYQDYSRKKKTSCVIL